MFPMMELMPTMISIDDAVMEPRYAVQVRALSYLDYVFPCGGITEMKCLRAPTSGTSTKEDSRATTTARQQLSF